MKKIFLAAGLCCMSAIPVSAQKDSNHNFEISKNLEIFNDIYKQLDMFYVDSLSADTVIEWGIDAMLRQVDPFTMYYPEEGMDELKEMTTGKYAGIGAVIRFYKKEDRVMVIEPGHRSRSERRRLDSVHRRKGHERKEHAGSKRKLAGRCGYDF